MCVYTGTYIESEILYSHEKEQAIATCSNTYESLGHNVGQKKPGTNKYILYDSIYMEFQNGQNEYVVTEIKIVVTL